MKALVTVELQLSGDLFLSFGILYRLQNQLYILCRACFIGNNAVVKQISDYGKIQYTFLCVYTKYLWPTFDKVVRFVRTRGYFWLFPFLRHLHGLFWIQYCCRPKAYALFLSLSFTFFCFFHKYSIGNRKNQAFSLQSILWFHAGIDSMQKKHHDVNCSQCLLKNFRCVPLLYE